MPGEYELLIGPMSVTISGPGGSANASRLPTVKQKVVLAPGVEQEVTLTLTLKPKP